jgi:hypothetical protein
MPEFEDLPFFERPDLSPYLVHLTKNTRVDDDYSAYNPTGQVHIPRLDSCCGV